MEPLAITDADWDAETMRIGRLVSGECEFVFFRGTESHHVFRPNHDDAVRLRDWLTRFIETATPGPDLSSDRVYGRD